MFKKSKGLNYLYDYMIWAINLLKLDFDSRIITLLASYIN
jgi:hypothetical protein